MDLQASERPERAGEAGGGRPGGRFAAIVRVVHPRPPPAERAAGDERLARLHAFGAAVEEIAEAAGALLPLAWEDDGVTLLIAHDKPEGLPLLAHRVASHIWHHATTDLGAPVRVAAHVACVPSLESSDAVLGLEVACCRGAAAVLPAAAPVVTEDVALGLPDGLREALARVRGEGGEVVYAPREAVSGAAADPVGELCDGLRRYVRGSDFARLRYVGFRLQRKEPPSLDVREVFVPQRVRPRRDRPPRVRPGAPGGGLSGAGSGLFSAEGGLSGGGLSGGGLSGGGLSGDALSAGGIFGGGLSGDGLSGSGLSGSGLSGDGLSGEEGMSGGAGPGAAIPLEAAVERSSSLVFLGDPGSGKTTLLRWVAVVAAGGRFAWGAAFGRAERWVPVPLSVGRITELRRSFAPGHPSVIDVAARYFRERNVPLEEGALREALHEVLSAGEALVLLDGLDEVRSEERAAIRGWLESFAAQYPRCRFFASSREVGYSGFGVAGGEEVRVEPFDAPQVERFVHAFVRGYRRMETGEDAPEASARTARDFLAALERDPRLGALARNPFLLSALALMHRSETRLPRHRVLAYELFSRALCETWADARRLVAGEAGKPSISYEDEALPVLGHLALAMHEEHPDGAAPEDFVLDKLEEALSQQQTLSAGEARRAARAFLARAGEEVQILLPRGPEQWGFLHLTFQEFFAAAGLHAQERFEAVLFEKLFDPRWLEVLRLGTGYLALVQKRPRKVNDLVLRVLDWRQEGPRAWLTETLKKQVVRAAQLAAEAGDALRQEVRDRVVAATAEWLNSAPGRPAQEVEISIGAYELSKPLALAMLSAAQAGGALDAIKLGHVLQLAPEIASEAAQRALLAGPDRMAEPWFAFLSEDHLVESLKSLAEPDRSVVSVHLAVRRLEANAGSITAWRDALHDPNPAHRRACAPFLKNSLVNSVLGSEEGRALLVQALGDDEPAICRAAFAALLRLPAWTPAISSPMRAARGRAVGTDDAMWHALLAREARAADPIGPFLDVLLAQSLLGRFAVRDRLAMALAISEVSSRVRDALINEATRGVDSRRRAAAVAALAHWRSAESLAAAVHCLVEGPDPVRLSALWALERLDAERAAEIWLTLVGSPMNDLRTMAMYSLSRKRWPSQGRASLEDVLVDLAEHDPDEQVQHRAIWHLRGLRSSRVEGVLVRLASDGRQMDVVLPILAAWGIEDAAVFADRLDAESRLDVLWTLSENLPPSAP